MFPSVGGVGRGFACGVGDAGLGLVAVCCVAAFDGDRELLFGVL